ncbi:hypothetical protein CXB51_014902 [Gossypium anomalum]|uniref:Uncharacterized protein n=1 Tax=Gossypium anomalum TaxID=47600 RepID=A0A8J5Z4V8_9ROSI|nr:hypothetical protein CXB51_014902 [Gossypium anomalum]
MASSNTPILVDDGFNEYESVSKCQKSTTSKVWDETTKLECENKDELKAQYLCYKLNYVQHCFTTIYNAHASNFVQIILNNLKLLFDKYVKNSKAMSSSLAKSSNVLDNDPDDSSLHQLNVNKVDLGGDCDENDDYKQYFSESSAKSERSQLEIYLEEPELELNSQIDVLDYWSKISI